MVIDQEEKRVSLTDAGIPWDARKEQKEREREKVHKYTDLKNELQRLWCISRRWRLEHWRRSCETLNRTFESEQCRITLGLLQKSVLVVTGHILHRVLES